jgi:hypothetical protein
MGRTACTKPQCLYSRTIPLLPLRASVPVQSLSACTVELYLYSLDGPYGLYWASVPVQSLSAGTRVHFTFTFNVSVNVTLRRVRATIVAAKSNKYYIFEVCVCNLRYQTCNAHAPCCHLLPVRLYNIFPYHPINRTIFGGGITEHKMWFFFSTKVILNIYHFKRKSERLL